MLLRIVVRGHSFTAAGDAGEVSVYDHRGRVLVTGLRDGAEAEAWCARHASPLSDRPPLARPAAQIGRSIVTGY